MSAQDDIKEMAGRDRLRSNLAQLLIVFNGLIFTITLFVVASFFVHQDLRENAEETVSQTRQLVIDSFHNARRGFDQVASAFQGTDRYERDALLRTFGKVRQRAEFFDQIYWLDPSNGATLDYEASDVLSLLASEGDLRAYSVSLASPPSAFVAQLADQIREDSDDTHLLSDVPGTKVIQLSKSPDVRIRPFAFGTAIQKQGGGTAYLVGVLRPSNFIDLAWLENKGGVQDVVIEAEGSDHSLFSIRKNDAGQFAKFLAETTRLNIAGSALNIRLYFSSHPHAFIFQLLPWLLVVFGGGLTIVVWLVVRNSRSQSDKLKSMNRILARKNLELNNEILERERLNTAIQEAEQEYRSIINSVNDIIFEATPDGEILFLNETWSRVTGMDPKRSLSRNMFEMLHPQDQEEQRRDFYKLVEGRKEAYRTFTRLRTAEGTFRAVEMAVAMLRQDEDSNIRIVGTFTDVEERRRAERALSEAERKYRTIWENAAGGIYQLTPDGQILSANPAMARMLGYTTPEDLIRDMGNAHDLYIDKAHRKKFIQKLARSDKHVTAESRILNKSGEELWVNENVRAVKDDEGNVLYYEGSMEDVTERKNADIDLHQAKVESDLANRAKTEFLANISHELRTPLNTIIGFSEIIQNEVFGPINERAYWEYARDIHSSGKSLLSIINDILDISRIEAGERSLNEGLVNIHKISLGCVELLKSKADSSEITIRNAIAKDFPLLIAEELALKQMISNLLSNAIKFTPSGGRVRLEAHVHDNGECHLSVTDTGIGLSEEEIAKAISPFGQIDNAFDKSVYGTGLGLTLVDALIKLHGGRLEFFSEKGLGTTVTLIFPRGRVSGKKASDLSPQQDADTIKPEYTGAQVSSGTSAKVSHRSGENESGVISGQDITPPAEE